MQLKPILAKPAFKNHLMERCETIYKATVEEHMLNDNMARMKTKIDRFTKELLQSRMAESVQNSKAKSKTVKIAEDFPLNLQQRCKKRLDTMTQQMMLSISEKRLAKGRPPHPAIVKFVESLKK